MDNPASPTAEIKRTPIEYAQDGRIFCGIELDEGADAIEGVSAIVGDGVLMYSSDYPHGGCRFPNSIDVALAWREQLGDETFAKIANGNARRFLRM